MGHSAHGAEAAPALQVVSAENAHGNAESGSVNEELALLTPFQLGPFKLSHRLVVTTSTALINHLVSIISETSKLRGSWLNSLKLITALVVVIVQNN
jgi:hypothetical protein